MNKGENIAYDPSVNITSVIIAPKIPNPINIINNLNTTPVISSSDLTLNLIKSLPFINFNLVYYYFTILKSQVILLI